MKAESYREPLYVKAHEVLYDSLVAGDLSQLRHTLDPEAEPMLVPPLGSSTEFRDDRLRLSGVVPDPGANADHRPRW